MQKVVLFTGGVETLTFFSKEIGTALNAHGLLVFYFDLKEPQKSAKTLKKFIKPGETVMLSFNFQGLEREEGVFDERYGYLWDSYKIPCLNIVVDHPMYYHDFLVQVPKRYYHISIDRTHEAYIKKYYPEIQTAGFLPLAGTGLFRDAGKKMADRSMDVVFTGNYTPPSFCNQFIYGINQEYADFYNSIIKDLLEHPETTLEDSLDRHCFQEMGDNSVEDLRFAYSKSLFLDLYVRNYERDAVIRTLAEGGVPVHVFGKDWDKLICASSQNIIRHPQTDSKSCLEAISDAKISLNVMPWFKDGAHDRIFNSMLNGAVSLTDSSVYLKEEFTDQRELMFYDLLKLKELPGIIKELLKDEPRMQKIADTAQETARKKHTWANRAEILMELIVMIDMEEQSGYNRE